MTTSSSGLYGNFGQANYGAAKLALVGLMQTLAIEVEKYGICVNCLAPTAATGMTEGVLNAESLKMLASERVSPALIGDDAPERAILCADGGHFAAANITLTHGAYVGTAIDAGEQVVARWDESKDREQEIVPTYGFVQAEREVEEAKAVGLTNVRYWEASDTQRTSETGSSSRQPPVQLGQHGWFGGASVST